MSDLTMAIIADLHEGSPTGLTLEPKNEIQEQVLDRYENYIRWLGEPPDIAAINGDAIDGLDKKGKDTTKPDVIDQAEGAAGLLFMLHPKKEFMITTGTRYHTDLESHSMERLVADKLRLKLLQEGITGVTVSLRRKWNLKLNGWFRLEMRHKIGRSTVPYGRSTSPVRNKFWNVINAGLTSSVTKAPVSWPHLQVFSHVHYFNLQRDAFGSVMTTPCWQAIGSRFGDEECEGHIDLGGTKLVIHGMEDEGWELKERLYLPAVVSRLEAR